MRSLGLCARALRDELKTQLAVLHGNRAWCPVDLRQKDRLCLRGGGRWRQLPPRHLVGQRVVTARNCHAVGLNLHERCRLGVVTVVVTQQILAVLQRRFKHTRHQCIASSAAATLLHALDRVPSGGRRSIDYREGHGSFSCGGLPVPEDEGLHGKLCGNRRAILPLAPRLPGGQVQNIDLATVIQVKSLPAAHREVAGIARWLKPCTLPHDLPVKAHPSQIGRPLGIRGSNERILRHHKGSRSRMISRPPTLAHAGSHAHEILTAQSLSLQRAPFILPRRRRLALHVEAIPSESLLARLHRHRPRQLTHHTLVTVVDGGGDIARSLHVQRNCL